MLFAVDLEALRVECVVNIVISIPHMPKKIFTYRVIVCELTGLCGYAYDKISCCCVPTSFSLKRSVRDLYSLRQLIIQSFSLGLNDLKTKGVDVPLVFIF